MLSELPPMSAPPLAWLADDDTAWFSREVHPHGPMLRNYLAKHFTEASEPEDIIQEAYLRILKIRRRRPIRDPRALLIAIARNLALDTLRRRKFRPTVDLTEQRVSAVIDETQDVPRAVMRRDELNALALAMASLPPRCRQTMTLRLQGLPQKEVAARLGISWSTVEKHVTIAIKACTACLRQKAMLTKAGAVA